jgi:NADPH-dependent 2,4-dienoyl-CoA reductase/sulfur reductase-like enzyme
VGPVADAVDLHDSGALAIDDYGRTSAPDVYVAGDCAAMPHAVTGDLEWAPLGPAANAPAGPSGVERPTSSHADRRWMHSPVRTA